MCFLVLGRCVVGGAVGTGCVWINGGGGGDGGVGGCARVHWLRLEHVTKPVRVHAVRHPSKAGVPCRDLG